MHSPHPLNSVKSVPSFNKKAFIILLASVFSAVSVSAADDDFDPRDQLIVETNEDTTTVTLRGNTTAHFGRDKRPFNNETLDIRAEGTLELDLRPTQEKAPEFGAIAVQGDNNHVIISAQKDVNISLTPSDSRQAAFSDNVAHSDTDKETWFDLKAETGSINFRSNQLGRTNSGFIFDFKQTHANIEAAKDIDFNIAHVNVMPKGLDLPFTVIRSLIPNGMNTDENPTGQSSFNMTAGEDFCIRVSDVALGASGASVIHTNSSSVGAPAELMISAANMYLDYAFDSLTNGEFPSSVNGLLAEDASFNFSAVDNFRQNLSLDSASGATVTGIYSYQAHESAQSSVRAKNITLDTQARQAGFVFGIQQISAQHPEENSHRLEISAEDQLIINTRAEGSGHAYGAYVVGNPSASATELRLKANDRIDIITSVDHSSQFVTGLYITEPNASLTAEAHDITLRNENGDKHRIGNGIYTANTATAELKADKLSIEGADCALVGSGHAQIKVSAGDISIAGAGYALYAAKESLIDLTADTYRGQGNLFANETSELRLRSDTANITGHVIAQNTSVIKMSNDVHVDGTVWIDSNSSLESNEEETLHSLAVNSAPVGAPTDALYDSALVVRGTALLNGVELDLRSQQESAYQGVALDQSPLVAAAIRAEYQAKIESDDFSVLGSVVADGHSSVSLTDKTGQSSVTGDLFASNGAAIDLKLERGSSWEGAAEDYSDGRAADGPLTTQVQDLLGKPIVVRSSGQINVDLAGGQWTARGRNTLSTLNFSSDESIVDMTADKSSSLTVSRLEGNKGTIRMNLDGRRRQQSDMLYIRDFANPDVQLTIEANLTGGTTVDDLQDLRFATTGHPGAGKHPFDVLLVKDQGFLDMTYDILSETFETDDPDNHLYNDGNFKPGLETVNRLFNDEESLNWYLHEEGRVPSRTGETIMGSLHLFYRSTFGALDIDRLHKRMGDLRYAKGGDDGVWVRVRGDNVATDREAGNISLDQTLYQVGFDKSRPGDNGIHRTGLAIDYEEGDVDYRSTDADGHLERYGLSAYATWIGHNGSYCDAVVKLARLSNDFDLITSVKPIEAEVERTMFGFSFETGRQYREKDSPWFIEPQAQLYYTMLTGEDFTTTQDTDVNIKSSHSVITRAGLRAGRELGENGDSLLYAKLDWLHEWYGKERIRIIDATTGQNGLRSTIDNRGDWFDVGAGFQMPLSEASYWYLDAEWSFGNSYEDTFNVNSGIRWNF